VFLKTAARLGENRNQPNQRAKKTATNQVYNFKRELLKCLNISYHYKVYIQKKALSHFPALHETVNTRVWNFLPFFVFPYENKTPHTHTHTHTHTKNYIYCVSGNSHWKMPQHAAGCIHPCLAGWSYPSSLASESV